MTEGDGQAKAGMFSRGRVLTEEIRDAGPPGRPGLPPRLRVSRAVALVLPVGFVFLASVLLREAGTAKPDYVTADYSAPAIPQDRPAPDFTVPRLDGRGDISLHALSGTIVVLHFWAASCPPCRTEVPHLLAAWRTYAPRGVRFLGVNYKESPLAALAFTQAMGIPYPSVSDIRGEVSGKYGLFGLPTTFVLDRGGRIRYMIIGRVDDTNLRRALHRLLTVNA